MFKQHLSIDDDLRQLRSEAEQLQSLVSMLAEEPAEVRDVWHWQWDDLLDRVQFLCQLHRQGLMSETQQGEFLAVSRMLADGRTLIEALGCEVPPEISDLAFADA